MSYDLQQLNRELDRTKTAAFMGKSAAFLGSILCSLEFVWDETCPTAWINGVKVGWNPFFFLKLKPEPRKTVLVHELWHPASLHWLRMGDRNPKIWNYACDIRINNDLENEGYSFEGLEWVWKDQRYDHTWSVEMIYDDLIARSVTPPPSDPGDMREATQEQQRQMVNAVVQAVTSAKLSGAAGSIPGIVEQTLDKFLAPVIPWQTVLYKFFDDMLETDFSWRNRDRRFSSVYMPGEEDVGGRLEQLDYYLDVSGSVTDAQVTRFNSEVKYIKDTFNPKVLRLIQFDTRITKIDVFTEDEPFEQLVLVGRGGTSLECVREEIQRAKPTAAIIFSDLHCAPMAPLEHKVPIIWVCIDNPTAQVPFGDRLIHIKE